MFMNVHPILSENLHHSLQQTHRDKCKLGKYEGVSRCIF